MLTQSVIVVSDQIDMSALQSHHSDHCFQRMRLMTAYGTEFFSMNDVNRLRILQDVIDRRLTTRLAANRLEISDRHCRRLLERYREHGPISPEIGSVREDNCIFTYAAININYYCYSYTIAINALIIMFYRQKQSSGDICHSLSSVTC